MALKHGSITASLQETLPMQTLLSKLAFIPIALIFISLQSNESDATKQKMFFPVVLCELSRDWSDGLWIGLYLSGGHKQKAVSHAYAKL